MTALKANASPTKAFFVKMLTRDISLDDCILDLVDNSIDGAWSTSGQDPSVLSADSSLAGYFVDIQFSHQQFIITDNCGGINLNDASEYAFTFGRREEQERGGFTVGVYGIGMKRAVFKLGRSIEILSTYRSEGGLAAFEVPIEVDEWLAQSSGPWDFDIEEHDPAKEPGVTIKVRDLTDETTTRLGDPTYARALRRMLARDYMVPLMRGLEIRVNGEPVTGWKLELRENESFAPMRSRYDDGEVSVEIVAGMFSPPPDDREPDDQSKVSDVSGWYVLCNGRVVLAADTTVLTGWGVTLPKWHKQYTGFAGLVLFRAENPELLPMTTTKRNVDVSSVVYQRALNKMYKPARAWVDYTNARKQNVESVRELEQSVTAIDVFSVPQREEVKLPEVARPATRERLANVNYAVPLRKLRALASGLGNASMSYRDVGLESFEYAFEDLADEVE